MKILYGLPSEGMGHATRSKVIISYLMKNNDVRIVTSDRAYSFMEENFPGKVYEIKGFHLAYKNGGISQFRTMTDFFKNSPKSLIENFNKYRYIHKEFQPALIISDFESFTFFFAKFHKIPLISIDNIQVINRCKLDFSIPKSELPNYQIAKNIIKAKVPNANYYLITSFFNAEIIKPKTEIIPPILRDKIIKSTTSIGKHILVYQTSDSQNNIVSLLNQISNDIFYVYGFNRNENCGNVILKKFSEEGFIEDLASAKAIISNGGFSLISEAVYLKKPVCSIPIKGQFEQFVNAAYIEKCGYGRYFKEFILDSIKSFLYDINYFQKKLNEYKQDGNNATFKKINEVINSVIK